MIRLCSENHFITLSFLILQSISYCPVSSCALNSWISAPLFLKTIWFSKNSSFFFKFSSISDGFMLLLMGSKSARSISYFSAMRSKNKSIYSRMRRDFQRLWIRAVPDWVPVEFQQFESPENHHKPISLSECRACFWSHRQILSWSCYFRRPVGKKFRSIQICKPIENVSSQER